MPGVEFVGRDPMQGVADAASVPRRDPSRAGFSRENNADNTGSVPGLRLLGLMGLWRARGRSDEGRPVGDGKRTAGRRGLAGTGGERRPRRGRPSRGFDRSSPGVRGRREDGAPDARDRGQRAGGSQPPAGARHPDGDRALPGGAEPEHSGGHHRQRQASAYPGDDRLGGVACDRINRSHHRSHHGALRHYRRGQSRGARNAHARPGGPPGARGGDRGRDRLSHADVHPVHPPDRRHPVRVRRCRRSGHRHGRPPGTLEFDRRPATRHDPAHPHRRRGHRRKRMGMD